MGKGYQGRHKGDVALDNMMREAKNANYKERKGIKDVTAVDQCLTENQKKIKYKERETDPGLTAAVAGGYSHAKERKAKSAARLAEKNKELELKELSDKTGIPVEILRKNPNLKPLDWIETPDALTDVELNTDADAEEEATENND